MRQFDYSVFRQVSCVLLSTLVGLAAGLPLVQLYGGWLPVISTGLGGFVGYRKRNSTMFFYLALISLIILSGVLSRQVTFAPP